jgi:hypothetical protein
MSYFWMVVLLVIPPACYAALWIYIQTYPTGANRHYMTPLPKDINITVKGKIDQKSVEKLYGFKFRP